MKITGAQILADMLAGYGVSHVFMVPAVLRRTFAEMEPHEKHRWSHRGAAVRALLDSGALSTI